jgi:hypothetical protein
MYFQKRRPTMSLLQSSVRPSCSATSCTKSCTRRGTVRGHVDMAQSPAQTLLRTCNYQDEATVLANDAATTSRHHTNIEADRASLANLHVDVSIYIVVRVYICTHRECTYVHVFVRTILRITGIHHAHTKLVNVLTAKSAST